MLSLEDEALDAILEIDESDTSKENGVDFIIERLNRLFKKDSEALMTFKRPSDVSIQAYLNEFDMRFFKTKSYGTVMSDDILAYRLLQSVNLSTYHEELVKATILDLQYDIMKTSITRLGTHQTSSQQIKTMTHITPGEIIAITNKIRIP